MAVPTGKATHGRFRHRRYGIYDLTYEDATSPACTSRIYASLDGLRAACREIPYVSRQLFDMMKLAPIEFVAYMAASIWRGIYLATNLYWLNDLFNRIDDGRAGYWSLAMSWITCVMINIAAERTHARSLEVLTIRSRAHFLPKLIRASLRVDLLSIHDLYTLFPVEGRFVSESPGGRFLRQLSQLVQGTLDLTSQLFVLLSAISRKRSPEREVLLCFFIIRGVVWWLAPSNGIGCSAYIYWPNNHNFHRMKALFGLAFSTQYRADLVLDGVASSLESEYRKSTEKLGNVEDLEPTPWRTDLLRAWHWDFLMGITLDIPIVIYALLLSAYLSPPSIASMALLQQAARSISLSVGQYASQDTPSLLDVFSQARRLYDAIDYQSTMPQDAEPFPRIDRSYDVGMKISFRHVSLRYPGSDRDSICNASFDILPGELVLVVGTNGSGKSSMLRLMARLFDPTAGEILVDDLPLVHYDVDQLRSAITFQSRSPVVYPVTVWENIAFGLPPTFHIEEQHVEEAAQTGGCSEWISKLGDGYDTQLEPSFDINHGWLDGVYGYPSEALKDELARHKGHLVSMSDGEKQRLATARTFMRINNRTTRLVVVDEATSSLDSVAERDILNAFRNVRAGKTIVLVTHRFHRLAYEADRILCMKDGCIVESGTHASLLRAHGVYATLYHAQVDRTG